MNKTIKEIYEEICQCKNQCLNINDSFKIKHQSNICNKIEPIESDKSSYYYNLIDNALYYFIQKKYIQKINSKYYITSSLNTNLRLSWENIKYIKKEKLKILFWLFRKLIVDSIIKYIILKKKIKNINIYSVGSTTITSDYDITLYSNDNTVLYYIITSFDTYISNIFNDNSNNLFDTNLYSKSYIVYSLTNSDYLQISNECKSIETFYYLKELDDDYKHIPILWGILHFLSNFRNIFNEYIYNTYIKFLSSNIQNLKRTLNNIQNLMIFLRNSNTDYKNILLNEENIKILYNENNLPNILFINDFVSYINFYGNETYYTRGAFLDVVVNTQMCNNNIIKLKEEDYISSILENGGYYFIHNNKLKYIKRIAKALDLLSKFENYKFLTKYINEFNNTKEPLCDIINNNNIDLLNCNIYYIYNIILKLVYDLLKFYFYNKENISFPFYNIHKLFEQNYISAIRENINDNKEIKINLYNKSKHKSLSNLNI